MTLHPMNLLPRGHVPNANFFHLGGSQNLAVRRKREPANAAVVAVESANFFSRHRIPETNRVKIGPAVIDNHLAVRSKSQAWVSGHLAGYATNLLTGFPVP